MRPILRMTWLLLFANCLTAARAATLSSFDLRSPGKRIEVRIRTADGVRYDVVLNGRAILENSSLAIDVDRK
jgi:hypothetical protein